MANFAKAARKDEASEGARERVLRVGRELFSAKGFEGTGLRELAAAAGVNHSLVLYHFGSMDGLWKAVVGELIEGFRRRNLERLAGLKTLDAVTRIKITIEDFVRSSAETPELHRMLTIEGRRRTPRLTWLVETYLKPMYREHAVILAEGQADGTIRPFSPALLYYAFLSLGGTPAAFAPEIEAVTGLRTNDETTIRELTEMISTLLFVEPQAKSSSRAKKKR